LRNRHRRRRLARALAPLPWLFAACGSEAPPDARPVVAVSVVPQAWLVERLAGARVRIVVMIPPGANEATHEPELAELRALSRASLYVKVGHPHFPFEQAWLDRLLAERPDLPVVDSSRGLDSLEQDPHVWVSPVRVLAMVGPLADALATLLPQDAEAIREREARLRERVREVDAGLREILGPARGGTFLVLHPAWGYLAEDYGLVQLAIQHENREPDPRRVAELVARARALGIDTVFVQPQFDPASARVVADAVGARVETLDPLAPDWDANLERVARQIARAARG